MCRLVTVHSVTDRQPDRRHYHANSRSSWLQYDRIKITKKSANLTIFLELCELKISLNVSVKSQSVM